MKITLTALTVAATLFAGSASAFNPDDPQKLKYTNKCKSCDLSGANLMGANVMDAIMMYVILCKTTMSDGSVNDSGC